MSTPRSLLGQYQKWFEIAQFENRMIREKNWEKLNSHRDEKEQIMAAIQELEGEGQSQENMAENLRQVIFRLADLERLNHDLSRGCLAEISIQQEDLDRRIRLIHQLRDRYEGSNPGNNTVSQQG